MTPERPEHDALESVEPTDRAERLISRYLDGECTEDERRELRAFLRRDRSLDALIDDFSAIDREARSALRSGIGGRRVAAQRVTNWRLVGRVAAGAVAAAIALLTWHNPAPPATLDGRTTPERASWFAPPPTAGDTLVAPTPDQPSIRIADSKRNWIVVPGERAGEYLVIEVKQVKSRTIPVQRDY